MRLLPFYLFPFLPLLTHALPSPLSTCCPTSFTNITTFPLTEYLIETVTTPRENGIQGSTSLVATFSVRNPGTGDTYRLERIPLSTGGGVWSTCLPGDKGLPVELRRCQYLVERGRKDGRVGFRLGWGCGTLVYDATLIANLPTEVCTAGTGVNGVTQSCVLDAKELPLEVANIWWEEGVSGGA